MEKIITYQDLRKFAYSNDRICKRPINGIVRAFVGLGDTTIYEEDTEAGILFAEAGVLYLLPYYNPWAWMNRQTVAFVDELVDLLFETFELPEETPIVSTGGSMGGLSALVYIAKAKHKISACIANCPVCDLPGFYAEFSHVPRTLYSAFGNYDCSLQEAMESASPVHLVDQMPDIPYYIFHCAEDDSVLPENHSEIFVEKMRKNHRITYHVIPGRGHCDLPEEVLNQYYSYALQTIEKT